MVSELVLTTLISKYPWFKRPVPGPWRFGNSRMSSISDQEIYIGRWSTFFADQHQNAVLLSNIFPAILYFALFHIRH